MHAKQLPIAVIGAGFSGTMVALHLLPRLGTRTILLCERGERFARGTAYGTFEPAHLLNVRAANMSAYPDRPDHFVDWLSALESGDDAQAHETQIHETQIHETPVGTFVSRGLYGRYLTSLLRAAVGDEDGSRRLVLVGDEAVDLLPDQEGYRLVLASGREHRVGGVVLAVGNLLPVQAKMGPYIANPWSCAFAEGLRPGEPVVVIGSGLTMVDAALQLRASGFPGPVIAISRRGLLPLTHGATSPWPKPALSEEESRSLPRLLRRLRMEAKAAQAEDVSWRSVVDSLRPITLALWQGLPEEEQRRFLRHARPWWDIHRHRMAPPVGRQIAEMVANGYLRIHAGRILSVETGADGASVSYRPRGRQVTELIEAQRVINARGTIPADQAGSLLLNRLIGAGLARPDRHGLGLALTDGFEVVGEGGVTPGLWALGPLGRGVFWECTAVPDIRNQAARIADLIASGLS
jgi:uncharacterized NAD(P)/FAD-binding protein YdhS